MPYKLTEWEFSNEEEPEARKKVTAGEKNLLIKDARYDPDQKKYSIDFIDLNDETEFTVHYFMERMDGSGNIIPSTSARGSLFSLSKALFADQNKGIRPPCDIIGGVVHGEVILKTSQSGNEYPRIYKYSPAKKEFVELASEIDQYAIE